MRFLLAATTMLFGSLGFAASAQAADVTSDPWLDSIKYSGHAEGGVAFNTASPANTENFGSLFTDKSNQPQLNQLMLTAERSIDSASPNFGFKLQGLFGTDARYTHSLGETDHLLHSKYQLDVSEATVSAHLPGAANFFENGIDLKIGQFQSPMGAESVDATENSLYSHSYIFSFSPFKNTGLLATAHISQTLDLYAGLDTGEDGGITAPGDNNHNIKGQFGFGLNNLMNGKLTVLAFSHVGTENPAVVNSGALRYVNDVTITYKADDKLTFVTDTDYLQEDSLNAVAYGVAQYAAYAWDDHTSFALRGEVWRDNSGFFAGAFPGYFENTNAQRGIANSSYVVQRTTYGELTLGMSYKPGLVKKLPDMVIRPELRADHSFNDSKPFNAKSSNVGTDNTSFTPAVDLVIPF